MRPRSAALLACLLAPVGCAGSVSDTSSDAEAGTTTGAVIVVERNADQTQGTRAEGIARFVRVAAPGSVADALSVVGAALELPPLGACATVASLAGSGPADGATPSVQLVDVGAVSLVTDGSEIRLLPRQLPDVTDVVAGVVYDRAAEAAQAPAAAEYVTRVAGGRELAGFEVHAVAPSDPGAIRVGGEDDQGTLVASGSTIELTWTLERPDDAVYVDVRPSGVRCAFAEVGHGSLSTLFFDETGTIVVHRLRREAFRTAGVDSGEIRFDFARTIGYVRR